MKLLIGGSPCTKWSIAQTKNRETEPNGIGWELFENYLIALDKFQPDYFLYENNKSMSKAISAEITKRFGFEPICINSALVSAQNRQRLYWCGKRNQDGTYSRGEVEQPEDKGILLRDILETGVCWREKAYTLDANYNKTAGVYNPEKQHSRRLIVAEPVSTTKDGKSYTLKANYAKSSVSCSISGGHFPAPMAAEPVRIGTIESDARNQAEHDSKQYRVYSPNGKSVTLCGQGGGVGAKTGLYAVPLRTDGWFDVNIIQPPPNDRVLAFAPSHYEYGDFNVCIMRGWQCTPNSTHGVTHWSPLPDAPMQEPCAGRMVGRRINEDGHRDDYNEGIERFQRFELNENPQKTNCLSTVQKDNLVIESADGKTYPIYEVRNGLITVKGKQYPIKLADGFYIIRKLTVTECKRLQTVPEWYEFPVSDTQAYKMLGNGWTVDVIAHILSYCPGITAEPLDVLSMYDGMACGHIALDKLGAHIMRYRATEIDKYAIKTACYNFPDIEQLGDAFQVRTVNTL